MKKLLTLFIPIILPANLFGFVNQKENLKDNNQNIVLNLNINENKDLPNTGDYFDGLVGGHGINFNFTNYATDLNTFVSKYPYFMFSSDNYLRALVYNDSKTEYLNQKYSTKSLISDKVVFLDTLKVGYQIGSNISGLVLQPQLGVLDNQTINFLINYTGVSNLLPVSPSYYVHINTLTFLTS